MMASLSVLRQLAPNVFGKFWMRIGMQPVDLSNQDLTFTPVFSLLCKHGSLSYIGLLEQSCWRWSELLGISFFLWNHAGEKKLWQR